jgi:hypothetical protein
MALAFSLEEKKERIRQAMEVYSTTGSWSKADNIVRRQSVEKWVRNPELLAYATTLGYQQMCTDEVASFAPVTAHYTARIAFSGALVHMRDGKYVCRDGARIHYAICHGQMVMYKLDGAGTRHHAGPAYFRGADVMANDWMIIR